MENKIFNSKWIIIILLCAAVIIPYFNIFNNEFAYDDSEFFLQWEGIKKVDVPASFAGNAPLHQFHVYRPLRSVIMATVYHFSTTNPFGYHLFALGVHLLNVFLLYLIGKKLLNKTIALISAILFAVLPVHTMSVTFMAASFNTAGIAIMLASFYLYILWREKEEKKFLYFSYTMAVLAFFTYELTLVLPFLIILYDICFKNLTFKQIKYYLKYYLFYFISGLLFFVVRHSILSQTYKESLVVEIDFFSRILTMSKAFIIYIYLTIVNFPLSVHYDTIVDRSPDIQIVAAFLIIFGLLIAAGFFYKKNLQAYSFIILWFFVCLLPVSNIIPIAYFVSEQYLYLASFSWTLLAGIIFYKIYQKNQKFLIPLTIIFVILTSTYSYLTWSRNKDWQNDFTLWTATLARQPDSIKANHNLAFYYRHEKKYDLAKEHLQKVLSLNPEYSLAYVSLGMISLEQEKLKKAIEYFEKAISIRQNDAGTYNNLGMAYHQLGQLAKAEENYKKALEIYPDFYDSQVNLAILYLSREQYPKAIMAFERAIEIRSDDHEIYFGLALSYLNQGQKTEAKKYLQKTLEIKPDFTPAKEQLNQL